MHDLSRLTEGLFRTIYADPPWPESGGGRIKRGADRHYPLMTVAEIKSLPVKSVAADQSHLYLWVTNNHLPSGLEVMQAWGFRYVTCITWAKEGRIGLGQYFRGRTEHCLFGIRGRALPYRTSGLRRCQGTTLIWAKPSRHSVKPELVRLLIERVSYPPYLELFARRPITGWTVWGDEVA